VETFLVESGGLLVADVGSDQLAAALGGNPADGPAGKAGPETDLGMAATGSQEHANPLLRLGEGTV